MTNKRGQITLFIIVSVVIVALIIFAFILVPRLFPKKMNETKIIDPKTFIGDCTNSELRPLVETLASQGGYFDPAPFFLFANNKVQFLCYAENGICINQKPLLKEDIENQLNQKIRSYCFFCISNFVIENQKVGNSVRNCREAELRINVTLEPSKVSWNLICPLTIQTKDGQIINLKEISYYLESPLYEQVILAKDIVNAEIEGNDLEFIMEYLQNNPNVMITRNYRGMNGEIKIYNITIQGTQFLFAVKNTIRT